MKTRTLQRGDFWEAVRDFDLKNVSAVAATPNQEAFARALSLVLAGKRLDAIAVLGDLLKSADEDRVRSGR